MSWFTEIFCFADAGIRVGSGHIFRLYPVVEALARTKIPVEMITPVHRTKLVGMGLRNVRSGNAAVFAQVLGEKQRCTIIVDSYRQRKILSAQAGANPIVLFDDHYAPPQEVALVINAAPSATPESYRSDLCTLLGPKYASVHSAFCGARRQFQVREKICKIMVALGGNDTGSLLPALTCKLLGQFSTAELVVCGAPGADIPKHSRVVRREWVSQAEMGPLMASCDLAVFAGGQMLVQAACIGLPTIAMPQSSNQALHAAAWENLGSALVAETLADLSAAAKHLVFSSRRKMSEAGRATVDGKGAKRIARELILLGNGRY